MSWNAWARRHRLARGIAMAVFMLIASAWLGDPPPRVGDEVPLRYQEHRSGKRVYHFDRSAYLFGD